MNKLISRISERFNGNSILLVGDFNYRDIDWKKDMSNTNDSHVASKFLDCVHENFLYQLVEEPTHQRGSQTPSLIDLISGVSGSNIFKNWVREVDYKLDSTEGHVQNNIKSNQNNNFLFG